MNRDLEAALQQRADAIVSAWRLGIGVRTIAQVTDLTAARIAQIAEQELALDDIEGRRLQNRPLSRTVERRMNAIPAAHMLRSMINGGNPYDVAIWTMAQSPPERSWTPEQLAVEMTVHGWPRDPHLEQTLEDLVEQRRQIHRGGPRRYQIGDPEEIANADR
jgi:hypothetical protein